MTDDIINPEVANAYETCMTIIENKGQTALASNLEMWRAMLEIVERKLWRAKFYTQEAWLYYVHELGYTGMSRATMFDKIKHMRSLVEGGMSRDIAVAVTVARPSAARELEGPGNIKAAAKDKSPDEYGMELLALPTASEAVNKVRDDKGNRVSMWIDQAVLSPAGAIVGVIVRSDSKKGYTAYDFKIDIKPQIQGNHEEAGHVATWLSRKLKGHWDEYNLK